MTECLRGCCAFPLQVRSHEVTLLRCHSTLNSCSNVISCHHPCALTHHSLSSEILPLSPSDSFFTLFLKTHHPAVYPAKPFDRAFSSFDHTSSPFLSSFTVFSFCLAPTLSSFCAYTVFDTAATNATGFKGLHFSQPLPEPLHNALSV